MDLGTLLIERASVQPPAHVVLVGAGGKTTTMLALVAAGTALGWRCCGSTTTKVGVGQIGAGIAFLSGGRAGDKLVGLAPSVLDTRFDAGEFDLLVVEADGARGKVVKAPDEHEPVIPATATHVIALIGADSLDRVIEDVAHRPMLVAALCGCGPYERLTVERAAALLTSERGGRKAVPSSARFLVGVTRIGPRQRTLADRLIERLGDLGVAAIALPSPD